MIRTCFFILAMSLVVMAQETTTTAEDTTTTTTSTTSTSSTSTTTSTSTTSTLWPRTVTLEWDAISCTVNVYEVVAGEHVLKGQAALGENEFTVVDVTPGTHCYVAACSEFGGYSNKACLYQDRGRMRLLMRPRISP